MSSYTKLNNRSYKKLLNPPSLVHYMKIKDLPEQNRPRERFLKHGPVALSDSELFAIILRTGSPSENVIDMSNRLIKEYGLNNLFDCSLKELQKVKGIGQAKAMQLLAMAELGKRYNNSKNPIKKITNAKDVFDLFHERLKGEKQEYFYALILNNQNHIINEELVSKGVLDSTIIHPREVFKPAIKHSASKIILIHNHPSGNPQPSNEDIEVTKKLIEVGKLIDIKVLDHVIIGNGSWWSWVED
ncbi:MAG: DNA repair protein RadC [Candidatus Pacearchaeota archaeon]|nr:DNA repair protein RadC [Candidatus Pacearchaeota archaeon]